MNVLIELVGIRHIANLAYEFGALSVPDSHGKMEAGDHFKVEAHSQDQLTYDDLQQGGASVASVS